MKRIALINDMSGFGKCSLTAAIPVISVMGMQACPLPTAVLSAQTGFSNYVCYDFTQQMETFTNSWKEMGVEFDGIYSGYLAGKEQIEKVVYFLEHFRKEDTLYLADPVMGDQGKYYSMFNHTFRNQMKELTTRADVLTPNLTELCLLAEVDYEEVNVLRKDKGYIQQIENICHKLLRDAKRPQTVIVTGIIREEEGKEYVGNLAVSNGEKIYIEKPYTGKGFSGTGDLFASVICGSLVKGETLRYAMEKAVEFLQKAIEEATGEKIPSVHGVNFENHLFRLL